MQEMMVVMAVTLILGKMIWIQQSGVSYTFGVLLYSFSVVIY